MAQLTSSTLTPTPSVTLSAACQSRTPSRSRSPRRRVEANAESYSHASDPLLSNLSPESTLEALYAVDAVRAADGTTQDVLAETIANVSPANRAFGVRAALVGQKLKNWYKEVRSWQWPDKRDAGLGKGFVSPAVDGVDNASDGPASTSHLGSLPTELALHYESRIEEIKDGVDTLDVDELKEHVLDQHVASRSRPVSAGSTVSNIDAPLSYSQLSDFSALITATILYALPVLSRLAILLERWSVRLKVLRLTPGLLSGMSNTQTAVQLALHRIENGMLPDTDDLCFSRESFAAARSKLELNVSQLGAQMDNILNALEGREDSLPEAWIDQMETIEADFATWATQAGKKALENEWLSSLTPDNVSKPTDTSKPIPEDEETTRSDSLPGSRQTDVESKLNTPTVDPSSADAATTSNNTCQSELMTDEDPSRRTQGSHEDSQPEQPSPVPPNKGDDRTRVLQKPDATADIDIEGNSEASVLLGSDMEDSISSASSVHQHLDQGECGSCASLSKEGRHQEACEDQPQVLKQDDRVQSTPVMYSADKGAAEMASGIVDATDEADFNSSALETPHVSVKSPDRKRALETDSENIQDDVVGGSPAVIVGTPWSEQHQGDSSFARSIGSSVAPEESSRRSREVKVGKILDFGFSSEKNGEEYHNVFSQSAHRETRQDKGPETNQAARSRPRLSRTTSLPSADCVESTDFRNQDHGAYDSEEMEPDFQQAVDNLPGSKLRNAEVDQRSVKSRRGERKHLSLRRSISATDLTTVRSEDVNGGRRDGQNSGLCADSYSSIDCDSSPTSSGSPDSPVFPIKPRKRPNASNHPAPDTNISATNPSQSKRLRPSPVITSTRSTSKTDPAPSSKLCDDHLDQKISALLTTIPGRIHLASASAKSTPAAEPHSLRRTSRSELVRSTSPATSRSSTPTQSITLTPAVTRSRRSAGHSDDSVKLYHLHRGGKSAPVKLFVRSVGEDGERVMVRVGGGWADLGEYLKEYVVHHGRRKVMEEKFEIKGLPPPRGASSTSNNYSSGRLTPTPSNGRATPAPRPGSAFDVRRPSSALSVRKTRRLTGGSGLETPTFTSTSTSTRAPSDQAVEGAETPPPRRLSVPSSVSADDPHTPPSGTRSSSTPLGLAGPKPRSRQVSMSPESEAWVEGVMGEARKKTGTLKHQYSSGTLRSLPPVAETETKAAKGRSVSDMGGGSLNRRGYLRVLNK